MADLPASFARRAAYLPAADALVVADVHLGRARESNVDFPLGESGDVRERFLTAVERFEPATVVVAGDLLHPFDRIPSTVVEAAERLASAVAATGADVVVTPGNHDAGIESVLDDRPDVTLSETYRLRDGTVVAHGHEPPDPDADRYVIGHDHPAITIEGEKHPCFLHGEGTYRGADVLMLPAFDRLARGAAVEGMAERDFLSPVLADGIEAYRPVVFDKGAGEALAFPPMGELREHL
ncbi:MAG: metallophosphoesterase [Halobacteriales archaeon]